MVILFDPRPKPLLTREGQDGLGSVQTYVLHVLRMAHLKTGPGVIFWVGLNLGHD